MNFGEIYIPFFFMKHIYRFERLKYSLVSQLDISDQINANESARKS